MDYYRVRNWERFQHYHDRNPPWIKLHFELLSSADWVVLDDASRVLAVACMLIASRNEGRVPADPNYIRRVAYLNHIPNFKPLLSCGFLENLLAVASASQADDSSLQANARPETEEETEAKNDPPKPPFDVFWEKFPRQRRGGKENALRAWKRATNRATEEEIVNGLEAYIRSSTVSRGFAKGATSWLNDDGWTYQDQGSSNRQAAPKSRNPNIMQMTQEERLAKGFI